MRSPSHCYYFRKLLDIDEDNGDDSSPRNTGSRSTLPSSSSTATNPQFKPTLGFDSSMALTILVLLTALFFMVFFSMYLRRFAEDNSINISRRRRLQNRRQSSDAAAAAAIGAHLDASSSFSSSNGLDPLTLRSLPLLSYDGNTTKEEEEEEILCSVCLSEFQEKETMKMIPYCGHAFHPQCIDKWFSSHSSCPLCRSTQLFRESSAAAAASASALNKDKKIITEKKDCLVVEVNVLSSQKRFSSEHNHRIVIRECDESQGKSTVQNGDTSSVVVVDDDDDKERKEASFGGLRRISSWSGLDEKVLLKRSSSF